MAFVKHLESVSFEKSQMKGQDTNIGMGGKEVCYDLLEEFYSLQPFWDKVMADCAQQRYLLQLGTAQDLLKLVREEFIELVDEMAAETVTDQASFQAIQDQITPKKSTYEDEITISPAPDEITPITLPNTANTLKSNEDKITMSPAPDVHVSTTILHHFLDLLEEQQTPHLRCCDQCNKNWQGIHHHYHLEMLDVQHFLFWHCSYALVEKL
jgi:hypothetical protein